MLQGCLSPETIKLQEKTKEEHCKPELVSEVDNLKLYRISRICYKIGSHDVYFSVNGTSTVNSKQCGKHSCDYPTEVPNEYQN
jgi:hypothetical protein